MGVADEIWQAFITAHPEAAQGRLILEQVNQKMAAFMKARNQQPLPDFEGLSPQQMHPLLSDPWGNSSPLRFPPKLADSLRDQIPFFILMEVLYQHLLVQPIKLTPKATCPWHFVETSMNASSLCNRILKKALPKRSPRTMWLFCRR